MKFVVCIDNQKMAEETVKLLGSMDGIRKMALLLLTSLVDQGAITVEFLKDDETEER